MAGPQTLPIEVELVLDVMPCQAMRRSYDSVEQAHPCAHFAEWGVYHSFDYSTAGPPPAPGVEQPSVYRGKHPLLPEVLSGCRKAPLLCVGINPNLPGWWATNRSAVNPYFDDYLQYAHYFRYRSTAKLRIRKDQYEAKRGGMPDDPTVSRPLVPDGAEIALESDPVTMYRAYQSLLDGLAEAEGWADHRLQVGEDLSYANMVACPSAKWTEQFADGGMPLMGAVRARGIVQECFYTRRHFLRQLFQSLPAAILVFSRTTARHFIRAMGPHFRPAGAPSENEELDSLLGREIRLVYGRLSNGTEIDARVLFMPHASAKPEEFKVALPAVIAGLQEEIAARRLVYRPETGHLARPRGGCVFCDNTLYRIGPCDYAAELFPLETGAVQPLSATGTATDAATERAVQERLLAAFTAPPSEDAPAAMAQPLDAAAPTAPVLVLLGKVVTMTGTVIKDGAIYIRQGEIDAVQHRPDPPPAGYEGAHRIETGGAIYPGLMDLHNHLAYNIMPLWIAGRSFQYRADWIRSKDYKRRISDPMAIVAEMRKDLIKPIVRYIEVKLLLGGVTSGQGMITRFKGDALYRGLMRNFERSADPGLPSISHRITDIVDTSEQIASFRSNLQSRFFFHLAEGRDARAREQFTILRQHGLLHPNLVAIHNVGLKAVDFADLGAAGVKVVWSPFSNLLLYGATLDINSVVASSIPFSLGSDWTPSGSRNLLFEMKVAFLAARAAGAAVDARRLAEAVTRDAADSAGWGHKLGMIRDGYYADLLVLDDRHEDPYQNLVNATEREVRLVIVAGHPRHGDVGLMDAAGVPAVRREAITIGGRSKAMNLDHPASPLNGLTLSDAAAVLQEEMSDLTRAASKAVFVPLGAEEEIAEIELGLQSEAPDDAFEPLAEALPPITAVTLDPLTVVDDPAYFDTLTKVTHLPDYLKRQDGIANFYR
ncbi:hypothetical protein D3093_33145 (plasmid) [Azospirillum argentinense]|uniref:Amidohydrolase-related domain-containing protein n=1 Tax=Azospirillum argentinense TaxID=2970906 RepID=A0A4D8PRY6_9PROT|nr:amidohydrolase family protein [Azospirillum argentinense]QCO00105.1 hypothetical protein D3093_33145 [Azospirillum argentinense]